MTFFDRHPRTRWAVPAAAGLLIVGGTVFGGAVASADAGLPPKTAQELLVDVQSPTTTAVSGTVVVTSDLGLPDLPMGTSRTASPTSLIAGSHTLRVWSDGPERTRVAILANSGEYDLVRNGQDVWAWSSAETTAEHAVMPPYESTAGPATMPSTPQEAAAQALAAIDGTTEVTTSGVDRVAGRDVYELILTPRQDDTLVARVVVAVDGETHVPLRVRVFSRQVSDPAFEIGFTSVDFGTPDPSLFTFTPPPGATVTEHTAEGAKPEGAMPAQPTMARPTMVGTGWSQVAIMTVPKDSAAPADPAPATDSASQAAAMLQALPSTSGPWGTGKVLAGTLFSVILTDDGRMAVGAVSPEALGKALAAS